jgi:molybdopterin molybdotransferase
MISVEEALHRLLAPLKPLAAEQVPVSDGFGRVLAEDIVSRRTQPPFAVSAMDGYAVRADDVDAVPARLRVVGAAPAGSAFAGRIGANEAVRIFTGAPMPAGADCVVIQEDATQDGDWVIVREGVPPGRYVRPEGFDFREGDLGLAAGTVLSARDIGLAAAMNRPWLSVRRRPRVAILATGDEVVMPGEPIGPNQIVSSNGLALGALVTACGGIPLQLGIALDDPNHLRTLALGAAGADMLVTTGGASVGEHDLVQSALATEGLEIDFWKIAMRPGKPLMVGRLKETPMLGLPGNPVSSLVCGLLFLKPALETLLGIPRNIPAQQTARLSVALEANDHRQDYLRAKTRRGSDGEVEVKPFTRQDSSLLSLLAQADCLVVRPPLALAALPGEHVPIVPFTVRVASI